MCGLPQVVAARPQNELRICAAQDATRVRAIVFNDSVRQPPKQTGSTAAPFMLSILYWRDTDTRCLYHQRRKEKAYRRRCKHTLVYPLSPSHACALRSCNRRGREILILPADPKRTHNQFATSLSRSATNAQQSSFYRGRAGCVPKSMIRITAPRGVMSRQTRVAELIIREPSVLCHHSTSLLVRDPALTTCGKLWTRLVG